jgi:hypothetical protein
MTNRLAHCARCGHQFAEGDVVVDVDVVASATTAAIVYELPGKRAHLQCPPVTSTEARR